MKVKSFGCSFFYGNDLHDDGRGEAWPSPSNYTWAALIAQQLKRNYECYAVPGSGNLQILEKIITQAAVESGDSIYLINWSWIERFDYVVNADPNWRDTWATICPVSTSEDADFYYRRLHSEPRDKLTTLIHVKTAIDLLQQKNIRFFMTYMDELMLDRQWHATLGITHLQDCVQPYLHSFDRQTFLEWSRTNGFEISKTLHPLEPAHAAAADYMLPHIKKSLNI